MEQHRSIEIDFEVHKRIEAERQGFEETPNLVLRRLLGIDAEGAAPKRVANGHRALGRSWSGKGVTLPHGTAVQMEYNGRTYSGRIDDGVWSVEGEKFTSPSAAAGGVALTKTGEHPSLDGWIYWRAQLPGEQRWIGISELRKRAKKSAAAAGAEQ